MKSSNNSLIPQHKRMAEGQKVGFKGGGMVRSPVGAGSMVAKPTGMGRSPLTTAKMNNGIPGMKKGGSCK